MALNGWSRRKSEVPSFAYRLVEGTKALEVVGESYYQDDLWRVVGGRRPERIRQPVIAVLAPDPKNPYDPRAVAVQIDRVLVGHLPRAIAALVFPPLVGMYQQINPGERIAVRGEVVGGSDGKDGRLGNLGVFLPWDPGAFGIKDLPSGANPSAGEWAGRRASKDTRPTEATLVKTADRLAPVIAEKVTKVQAEALGRSLDALESDLQALKGDLDTIGVDAAGRLLAQRLARFGFAIDDGPVTTQYLDDLRDELDQLVVCLGAVVEEWADSGGEDRKALKWEASGSAADFVDRINERAR
jgi:hypothetical protein